MLPKFYFINLDRSEDRLKHMEKFFKKIHKKTELKPRFLRIKAFDGKNENVDNFSNLNLNDMWHKKEQNRKAIGPEFGCTYSHIKAMHTFINDKENTDDVAFICEDDLELFKINKDYFKSVLETIIQKTINNDLVAVSCVGSPNIIIPLMQQVNNPVFLNYHNNRGKLYGTGCYLITRKLAKKIVELQWKNDKLIIPAEHTSMVADHFIYPQGHNTSFMIPSLFAIKPENDSYIHVEHLSMQESVQKLMFQMWDNFNIATKNEIAIISNNIWGEDYYLQKKIKYNTPTIGTKISPSDYINFLENFDDFIKIMPIEVKNEELKYPLGRLEFEGKIVNIHFVKEDNWDSAIANWEQRKKLLPNKSNILFKICDEKFNGELTQDLLKRFYKSGISKKVIFLSEYCEFREKYFDKKYSVKLIPTKYCEQNNKCCPNGKDLFNLCGIK